jgi:hypothetical protein
MTEETKAREGRATGPRLLRGLIYTVLVLVFGGVASGGYVAYLYLNKRPIPFVSVVYEGAAYSVASMISDDPLRWDVRSIPSSRVYTKEKTGDPLCVMAADPFMIQVGGRWYLFYEHEQDRGPGAFIALATSTNGLDWKHEKTVIQEPFHMSYPHVFEYQGTYYLLPETKRAGALRLYRATRFPDTWVLEKELLRGRYVDPNLLQTKQGWYLFATSEEPSELQLFQAPDLLGPWTEHPASPVARGVDDSRGAGRIIEVDGKPVRFAQDGYGGYGRAVNAFIIEELTPERYRERPYAGNPVIRHFGQGWANLGMHHIDIHPLGDGRWIACMDGCGFGRRRLRFSLRD